MQISRHNNRYDARYGLVPGSAMRSSSPLRKLRLAIVTFFLIALMSACGNSPQNVASLQKFDTDGVPAAPAWVAFKDGDGPWVQITTPSADMVWSHNVSDPAGRYAFA